MIRSNLSQVVLDALSYKGREVAPADLEQLEGVLSGIEKDFNHEIEKALEWGEDHIKDAIRKYDMNEDDREKIIKKVLENLFKNY